jgi:hypothetical protein
MNYVVIYYSHTGNNRNLALDLQRRLDCDCIEVREARPCSRLTILLDILFDRRPKVSWPACDFSAYNMAILVAPIWTGRIATPLASFIRHEKDELPDFAFISLCGGLADQQVSIAQELVQLTGRPPQLVNQLNVNELLPPEQRNRARYSAAYRVDAREMCRFDGEIEHFLRTLDPARALSEIPLLARSCSPTLSGFRSPARSS